jgi:hypothetical protein
MRQIGVTRVPFPTRFDVRADHFLDAYYQADNFAHNPFKLAEKQTVAVQIDSILKTSAHGHQVRWTQNAARSEWRGAGRTHALGSRAQRADRPTEFGRDREQPARFLRDGAELDRTTGLAGGKRRKGDEVRGFDFDVLWPGA